MCCPTGDSSTPQSAPRPPAPARGPQTSKKGHLQAQSAFHVQQQCPHSNQASSSFTQCTYSNAPHQWTSFLTRRALADQHVQAERQGQGGSQQAQAQPHVRQQAADRHAVAAKGGLQQWVGGGSRGRLSSRQAAGMHGARRAAEAKGRLRVGRRRCAGSGAFSDAQRIGLAVGTCYHYAGGPQAGCCPLLKRTDCVSLTRKGPLRGWEK